MTSFLPATSLTVRARDCGAPTAHDLLGRPDIPALGRALTRASATLRGFVESPLAPASARDALLARWDRGLDVTVTGGTTLRALDAASGNFHVHVMPPIGAHKDHNSIHLTFAPKGQESEAVVRTHPHSPDSPVGFYNADIARQALGDVRRILQAVAATPNTTRVHRLRAEAILERIERTDAFLGGLQEARVRHPLLGKLENAAKLAYRTKAAGDDDDRALSALVGEINAGIGDLPAELQAQAKQDIQTIQSDRKKWHDWRASTGVFTMWLPK